jgi:hypothetical protein
MEEFFGDARNFEKVKKKVGFKEPLTRRTKVQ